MGSEYIRVFSFGYDGQEERHHKIRWVQFSDQPGLGSHLPIVSHHCMGRSRQSWESKKYSGAFVSCRIHRLAIFIRRERMASVPPPSSDSLVAVFIVVTACLPTPDGRFASARRGVLFVFLTLDLHAPALQASLFKAAPYPRPAGGPAAGGRFTSASRDSLMLTTWIVRGQRG